MMIPYRNTNACLMRENFNKKLSATRVLIENAFGLLKGRFNQLRYVKFQTIEKTSRFVKACCVMHNICIDRADHWSETNDNRDEVQHGSASNVDHSSSVATRRIGESKRSEIAQMLTH
jgi:DDE superfamily endonuclease